MTRQEQGLLQVQALIQADIPEFLLCVVRHSLARGAVPLEEMDDGARLPHILLTHALRQVAAAYAPDSCDIQGRHLVNLLHQHRTPRRQRP